MAARATSRSAASDPGPLPLTPASTVWKLALNAHLIQPPAYDETHAYFALEGNRIAAYALWPGTRLWIVEASPVSAITTGGGLLFFTTDDRLVALDASDGSPAWSTALDGPIAVPLVWANGWLIAARRNGTVAALRAKDGTVVWQHDLGAPAHAALAVAGDRVYVPAANDLVVALQIESGDQLWQRRLGGMPNDILAADDRVFVGSTDHYLYCIDVSDGRVDWRTRAGSEVIGLPAIDERRLYFVSLDNVVRAVNRGHGVQQWIQMLNFRPMSGPVMAGASVVVNGAQSSLRALDLKLGKSAGDISVDGLIAAPVHAVSLATEPPAIVVVTRDVAAGDSVTLVARTLDPPVTPFASLANSLSQVPRLSPGG